MLVFSYTIKYNFEFPQALIMPMKFIIVKVYITTAYHKDFGLLQALLMPMKFVESLSKLSCHKDFGLLLALIRLYKICDTPH